MRIAVFDYHVNNLNAIGRMARILLHGLCHEHHFTVFAVTLDNPNTEQIEFVHVPVIKRPLFMLFVSYHLMAPLVYWWYRWRHGVRFDLVQSAEVNVFNRDLICPHFCNRVYLRDHWRATRPEGIRRVLRWLDHKLRALAEPLMFRLARTIVVPSQGMAREITGILGTKVCNKICVIENAIDVEKMRLDPYFDRNRFRGAYGFSGDDLVLSFAALGHFERKGLPLVLEAMQLVGDSRIKLIVVGGTFDMIQAYEKRARALDLDKQVVFLGTQADLRPYLWASDLFVLPSIYETFSIVTFEAASAGVPPLVTRLHGVEDYVLNRYNGLLVERTSQHIAEKLRFALENRALLCTLGRNAQEAIRPYDVPQFIEKWRALYGKLSGDCCPVAMGKIEPSREKG